MNFRRLVKTVNTKNYKLEMIEPIKLYAQYNPERFNLWESLHLGSKKKVLNMIFSPHYRFLVNREDEAYYKLQRMFGRNNKWIRNKTEKFLSVYEDIKQNGFTENLMVLKTPLVKNKYNKGFEIFEGHHRTSIALFLNIKEIPCDIINN